MASDSTSASGGSTRERAKLQLYSYCLSSCSWRVRIALNLKGLKYDYKAVNIYKGEQFNPEFLKLNPLGFVPVLVDDDVVISDSFAIILYLEEKYPDHPLLPNDLWKRALNLQVANIICSSVQPYQNIAVLSYIEEKVSYDEQFSWVQHHIGKGFAALEKLLGGIAGKYATGDEVFLADLFLAPQIYAAINRFKLDMVAAGKLEIKEWIPLGVQSLQGQLFNAWLSKFPLLRRLNEAYGTLPAFRAAMPDMQPDAVKP